MGAGGNRRLVVGGYRWGFGLLALLAVGANFDRTVLGEGFSAVSFFSYFTILSNLFAAGLMLYGAWPWTGRSLLFYDLLRGAAVVYMAIAGLVYGVLLADSPVTVPSWINTAEHRIMPVVIALDWLIDPPRHHLAYRRTLRWLAFPITYLIYSEIRGALVDWYPYPFLDPRIGGYDRVATYVLGITVTFVLVTLLVSTIANRLASTATFHPKTPTSR